jgi:enoyl-CoA hydratase
MEAEDVRYEVDGRVARVTLNRPRYRSAQSWQMLDQLDEALDRACEDRDVRVVVVRGESTSLPVTTSARPSSSTT